MQLAKPVWYLTSLMQKRDSYSYSHVMEMKVKNQRLVHALQKSSTHMFSLQALHASRKWQN